MVLVPLDGSRAAEHALPHALAIARRSGATVRLVHVHSLLNCVSDPWQMYHQSGLSTRLLREKQSYLRDVLQRIPLEDSERVAATLVRSRHVADALVTSAERAGLVVMTTHRRRHWGKWWHGHVPDLLLRKSPAPLLLVQGDDSPIDLRSDPFPRHILLPLDGSQAAEGVIGLTLSMGRLGVGRYTILHVRSESGIRKPARLGRLELSLLESAQSLRERQAEVGLHVVTGNRIAATVQSFAARQGADWIAVATQRYSGLAHWLHGGLARSLAFQSQQSVLVYHLPEERSAGRWCDPRTRDSEVPREI